MQIFTQGNLRIEDSGFLIVVDETPKEVIEEKKDSEKQEDGDNQNKKQKKFKKQKTGEAIAEPEPMEPFQFEKYFEQQVPLRAQDLKGQKPKHVYTVEITRALFTAESFGVYQRYQKAVHNEDDKAKSGYERFLCQVPLFDPKDVKIPENATEAEKDEYLAEQKAGSARRVTRANSQAPDSGKCRKLKDEGVWPKFRGGYHMLHRIDGELMAVGILDVLPQALSSVYLIYDPKYEFLQPGTLCALREIEYCQKIMKEYDPQFKFYYLGYYFQDCQKSVYKANYKPAQVACPHASKFVYLTEEVRTMISSEKKPKLFETVMKAYQEKKDEEGGEQAQNAENKDVNKSSVALDHRKIVNKDSIRLGDV